jgi:hypothetical protein
VREKKFLERESCDRRKEKLGEDLEGINFLHSLSSHFSFSFMNCIFVG